MSDITIIIYECSFSDGSILILCSDEDISLNTLKKAYNDENIQLKKLKEVDESKKLYWEQYFINHYMNVGLPLKNKLDLVVNHLSDEDKLTEKVQVLFSKNDMRILYNNITNSALQNNKKPLSISSYIRKIVKDSLINIEQKSYVSEKLKKLKNK